MIFALGCSRNHLRMRKNDWIFWGGRRCIFVLHGVGENKEPFAQRSKLWIYLEFLWWPVVAVVLHYTLLLHCGLILVCENVQFKFKQGLLSETGFWDCGAPFLYTMFNRFVPNWIHQSLALHSPPITRHLRGWLVYKHLRRWMCTSPFRIMAAREKSQSCIAKLSCHFPLKLMTNGWFQPNWNILVDLDHFPK